jgi:signal transduction histidine kinase
VSEESKEKIRQAIAEVRKALDAKQPVEELSKQLNDAIMAAGAEVYAKAQQQSANPNSSGNPENDQQQHKH